MNFIFIKYKFYVQLKLQNKNLTLNFIFINKLKY
jgi:hypothetical protein